MTQHSRHPMALLTAICMLGIGCSDGPTGTTPEGLTPNFHHRQGHEKGGGDDGGRKTVTVGFTGDVTAVVQDVPGSNTDRAIRAKGAYTLSLTFDADDLSSLNCVDENGDATSEAAEADFTNDDFGLSGKLEIQIDKGDLSDPMFAFWTSDIDGTDDLVTIRNPADAVELTGEDPTTVKVSGAIFRWFKDSSIRNRDLVKCKGVADYILTVSK